MQIRRKLQAEGGKFINAKQICSSFAPKTRYYSAADMSALAQAQKEYHLKGNGRLPVSQDEMWTATRAAHELQVPQRTLHIYAQNGLLNFHCGKKSKKFFLPSDIEHLLTLYEPPHYIAATSGVSVTKVFKAMRDIDIQPAHNRELHWPYWLIHKDDGELIRRKLAHKEKTKKFIPPLILPTLTPGPRSAAKYLPLSEAAKQLRLDKQTVRMFIKLNYLRGACRAQGAILIPKCQVRKFKNKYIATAEATEILKVPLHRLADLLLSFDILSVDVPKTQTRLSPVYRKREIIKLARQLGNENPAEKFNYLATTSAANRLHASDHAIRALAESQILPHRKGRLSIYVRPSDLNIFIEKYATLARLLKPWGFPSNVTPRFIETLQKYKTTPFKNTNKAAEFFHFSTHILSYLNPDSPIESENLVSLEAAVAARPLQEASPPSDCTMLEAFLSKYRISHSDFYQTFLKLGFITLFQSMDGNKYLSKIDSEKCSHILDTCLTRAMADNIVFHKRGTSQCLIRRKILQIESPFPSLIAKPLIHRKKLDQYIALHPIGSHLKT